MADVLDDLTKMIGTTFSSLTKRAFQWAEFMQDVLKIVARRMLSVLWLGCLVYLLNN